MTTLSPTVSSKGNVRNDGKAPVFTAAPVRHLDNRGLPPPEPLVRTLEAVEAIPAGAILEILVDREPLILYSELKTRGHTFRAEALSGGDFRVLIRRSAATVAASA